MRFFCTYFDKNYLSRGLSLIKSLESNSMNGFTIFVLCLDEFTFNYLRNFDKNIRPIALSELEDFFPDLLTAKRNRNRVEYIFTLTPHLPFYLIKMYKLDIISYLDADILFFESPEIVFDELGSGSVLIIPHNFSAKNVGLEKNGKFNVGLVSFRNDRHGLMCLAWWKDRCLEWCYDRVEEGKFADQKYLEQFPELFEGVIISKHPGLNVAPYNLDNFDITEQDGRILIDGKPLVFFHYHRLKEINKNIWNLNLIDKRLYSSPTILRIYRSIIKSIRHYDKVIKLKDRTINRYPSLNDQMKQVNFILFRKPFYYTSFFKGIIDISYFSRIGVKLKNYF